jgi:DNA-binding response OmpR family regulator
MPRILVVDDDSATRSVLASWLAGPGRDIDVAENGEVALARIARNKPDLVISDVVMPAVNGFALLQKMRTAPETAGIPVILLTSLADREDRVRGLRLGAEDYVAKPVDLEELSLRADVALRLAEERRAAAASLRGRLSDVGFPSLLAFLSAERKTGVLVLTSGTRSARIALRDGEAIHAFSSESAKRGIDAVVDLFGWNDGRFELEAGPVEGDGEIGMNMMSLLLEACRRFDEHA